MERVRFPVLLCRHKVASENGRTDGEEDDVATFDAGER